MADMFQDPARAYQMQMAQSLMAPRPASRSMWGGAANLGSTLIGALLARHAIQGTKDDQSKLVEALRGLAGGGAGGVHAPAGGPVAAPGAAGVAPVTGMPGVPAASGGPMSPAPAALTGHSIIDRMLQSDVPAVQQMGAQALLQSMLKGEDPETFSAPTTVVGPDGKPVLVQPGNRGTLRPVTGYAPKPDESKTQVAGGFEKDPATGEWRQIPGYHEQQMRRAAAGATNINTQVSPTAIWKDTTGAATGELYKGLGKRFDDLQTTAAQSADRARQIKLLNATLGDMDTNATTDWRARLQSWAKAAGISVDESQLATVEAARGVAGHIVMQQLNAMKGPATEKEREYLQQIEPQVTTSPRGRKAIQYVAEHQAKRDAEVAKAKNQISNAVERRELMAGDANDLLEQAKMKIDAEFDAKFDPPSLTDQPATQPATPPAAADEILKKYGVK